MPCYAIPNYWMEDIGRLYNKVLNTSPSPVDQVDSGNLYWNVSSDNQHSEYIQLCYTRPPPTDLYSPNTEANRNFFVSKAHLDSYSLISSLLVRPKDSSRNAQETQTVDLQTGGILHENIKNAAIEVKKYFTKGTVPSTVIFQNSLYILNSITADQWKLLFQKDQIFYNFHIPLNSRSAHNPAFSLLKKHITSQNFRAFCSTL